MTIKATFPDGSVMLFGDSYKKWFDQLREFCLSYQMPRPQVVKCPTKWISFGGVKWCPLDQIQQALDYEGQGRKASEFAAWKRLNQIEQRTLEKHIRP